MLLRASRPAAALLACVLLAGCGGDGDDGKKPERDPQSVNVYSEVGMYTDPDSRAAQAAASARESAADEDTQRVLDRLADTPQGIWLTPEQYPAGEVGPFVTKVVTAADEADEVPTFVLYGIPDRDCTGGFSGGGLPPDQYRSWVDEIADAARPGNRAVMVIEPDALASALECDRLEERVRLISHAVDRMVEERVTTYVDGGHSNWIEPDALAQLLQQVGVGDVRGFATNVSNYQTDDDERRYGEELSELLGGDVHYIIDSGRNGIGSTDDWCNPSGRAFGVDPSAAPEGDAAHLDAYVWVKPPGESDGECNGGPPAGEFWPERVQEMAVSSGW